MKFIIIFILLFSDYGCSQANELVQIKYRAYTRGSSMEIIASEKNISFRNNSGEKNLELSDKDWSELNKLLSDIGLSNLESFEAPSDLRAGDAAKYASLTVKSKDEYYKSQSFDHGNPPKVLKKIVVKLFELVEIEN